MPDAAIGADVMVGFPGETEVEFEESRQFIQRMPFTYLHVFTYSERPGTEAASSPRQVPMPVRKQRNKILRDIASEKNRAFRQSMRGKTLSAVTLEHSSLALSDNYLKIELSRVRPPNQLIDVEIGSVSEANLREAAPFHVL
jgi:threonylcarbamoyladenosine tRNA methylthiotransferase MtaB